MKKLSMGIAAVAVFMVGSTAWGQVINEFCPVKGKAAKPNLTAKYKGNDHDPMRRGYPAGYFVSYIV